MERIKRSRPSQRSGGEGADEKVNDKMVDESMVNIRNMEERSKVAAAAMSAMTLCCIICFDEFCAIERPPMVLPCGHTYVCLPCTKRLKKCMECRLPLFLPATSATTPYSFHPQHQQHAQQSRALGRYAPMSHNNENTANAQLQPHHPYLQPTPPTPLPIPKNLVLLSLMDAAERQKRVRVSASCPSRPLTIEGASSSYPESRLEEEDAHAESVVDNDENDAADDDVNKIIIGMATLSGPCGTYAVRERNGLVVVPHDPRLNQSRISNNNIHASHIEVPSLLDDDGEPPLGVGQVQDENAMHVEKEEEDESSASSSSSENEASSSSKVVEEEEEEDDCNSSTVAGAEVIFRMRRADASSPHDKIDTDNGTQDVVQRDEPESVEEEDDDDKETESFIIQSRLSFELAPRPMELPEQRLEQHEQPQEHEPQPLSSPIRLEYGQTVQVVSFYRGVAKLARDAGYIAASPRQLVKVGEPLDESCRIQGLLDTVSWRGKGLEKTLDGNRLIADGLQRQLDAAIERQPSHPIISLKRSEHAISENRTPSVGNASPRTPNGPADSPPLSAMHTPRKMDYFEPLTPTQHRTGSFDLHHHHHQGCRISPGLPAPRTPDFDADGIRIGFAAAPTMPRYTDRGSMDEDKMDFGCGSSFMGAGGAELFGEGFAGSHDLSDDDYDGHHHRQHHHRHHDHASHHATSGGGGGGSGVPSLNPSLSASFDVVDFRTGMSCHRALNATKYGRSPKPAPPRRQVRTMGDHRGIAPIRSMSSSQQRRLQPNVPLFPTYSTPNGEEVSWYKE